MPRGTLLRKADEDPPPNGAEKPALDFKAGLLAVVVTLGGVFFLHAAKNFLIPVVLALLISYMLDPFVSFLERYRVPRSAGAAAMCLILLGSVGFAAYSLADNAMRIVSAIPDTAERLREAAAAGHAAGDGVLDRVARAASEITKTAEAAETSQVPRGTTRVRVAEPLLSASDYLRWGDAALGALGSAASILFLTFFMLASGDLYKRKIVKVAGSTLSAKRITVEILEEIRIQIGRFLLVQLLIGAMIAVATWIALEAMGIDQPVVWALAAGVFSTVPYFGPMLVTVGLGLVAFVQYGSIATALWVTCGFGAIATIKGFVIAPWLAGKATRMNQVAILIGLVFWIWIWGIPGMLLALPILTTLKAVCDRVAPLNPIGELLSD